MINRIIIEALISAVSLAIILATFALYSDPLFDASVDRVIPAIQEKHSKEATDVLDFFINAGVFALPNSQIIFVLANQVNRGAAFYFTCVYVTSVFIVSILQLAFHKPAPFWVSENISVNDCRMSYAAPSGPSSIATVSLLTMWSTLALSNERSCTSIAPKIVTFCLCLFMIYATSYVHLLNGTASIDEALLGVLLSIWTVVTFHFILMPRIFTHIRRLHQGKSNAPDLPVIRNLLIVCGASAFAIFLGLIAYWICNSKVVNDAIWE